MFNDQSPIHEFRGPWGVPIQIGGSILFILLFYISFSGTPRDIAYDVIFVVILMGSILLHELGHAWGCLIQSVPVRRIMLHGAGGFCERSRSATRYEQELIVAMGPLVTLALWALATLAVDVMHAAELWNANVIWALDTIAWINIYLFVFNMIPLQPLDGGKLFELFLARFMHSALAEKATGIVGIVMIVLWVPMMLLGYAAFGMMLMFIPALGVNWSMATRPLPARNRRVR
ncbi:MAG: Zn-dependent protease [Celeribacter sp.]|jgi:Zn-dependent protease